jgi:hypothetical protein
MCNVEPHLHCTPDALLLLSRKKATQAQALAAQASIGSILSFACRFLLSILMASS